MGLSRLAVALDDAALDARVGLPRWQAFAKSATGPVPALASRALLPTLKVVGRSLLDRLRALTPGNPFFDAQGQTRVQPHLMPREERAALRARRTADSQPLSLSPAAAATRGGSPGLRQRV